ncbi:hypothetical protein D7Y27_29175 [Corallococcus sp. AB004]|uniref:hypothetical protein n=1 Tax=Corallococcus exiguus TaxID=83462 RepID=UPI000EA22B4D|nr:hypothetical protein [Corallococcus exiguus]NPC74183.1 hypothetical protein [Corallococcus exiguus]NRD48616.1 hypothetical protein [Corallococcus exiguus]RKI36151.1 hypothetical protein D7Y27_29175 [Corallococcus sp. AB004]
MTGFKRAVGLGLLVGGALGGWGCGKESPPAETQGFQDPVQLQHRSRAEPAGKAAGSPLRDESGGKPYNSDSLGSLGGGSGELGTGLAESYRGTASEGTGGSGRDAGTEMMDAGTRR